MVYRFSALAVDVVAVIDELIGIFMAQYEPFAYEGLGDEYWSLVHQALSN